MTLFNHLNTCWIVCSRGQMLSVEKNLNKSFLEFGDKISVFDLRNDLRICSHMIRKCKIHLSISPFLVYLCLFLQYKFYNFIFLLYLPSHLGQANRYWSRTTRAQKLCAHSPLALSLHRKHSVGWEEAKAGSLWGPPEGPRGKRELQGI